MKEIFQDSNVIVGYFGERFKGILSSYSFFPDLSVERVRTYIAEDYLKEAVVTLEAPRDLKIGTIRTSAESVKVVVANRIFYVFRYINVLVINEDT